MVKLFKRKIYSKLVEWKNRSNGETAILIEGARRIGKTSVAKEFGKNEFSDYLLIDFSVASSVVLSLFDDLFNIDIFFERLFLAFGIKPLDKGSLIIFDEIQFCPKARQAIKTLVNDGRYFYIETGSLVSIKENILSILIPSEEERIEMYPMDYEEFLWALDLDFEAEVIRKHLDNGQPFDSNTHFKLMNTFRTYLAVGGMPKVVSKYVETKDYVAVDYEKKNIVALYEDDLRKIDNRFGTICYLIRKQMPSMLTKHSTRFLVSSVNERADSVLFTNTLEKLIESKMVIPVFKCSDPSGGYALTRDLSFFKLYFNDVGLFTSLVYANSGDNSLGIYQKLVLDKLHTNLGMLYENACAQILTAKDYEPYYYSWHGICNNVSKNFEIDFLIYKDGKTIPFEVKSRNVSTKASLEEFKKKHRKIVKESYIVYPRIYKKGENLTYLPYYMLFAL